MAETKSIPKKKIWKILIAAIILTIAVVIVLVLWKKNTLAVWYMEGNAALRETVILQMVEDARPAIEREIKMTLPQKILSRIAGKRNEQERQDDALADVRTFAELSFKNHWLKFKDVHKLDSLGGFSLDGLNFALTWNKNKKEEVLTAFDINILKRKIGRIKTNEACGFFSDLRSYIEKRAKEN